MRRALGWGIVASAIAAAAIILYIHRVDNSLTPEDRVYIRKILAQAGVAPGPGIDSQGEVVRYIESVQHAVLAAAPADRGIPLGSEREPKDLFLSKGGLCYDRSRTIEKILRGAGLEVRHMAVYSSGGSRSVLKVLTSPHSPEESHSVTEVRTPQGWMVVDSNARWLSVDSDGNPVSAEEMRRDAGVGRIRWKAPFPTPIYGRPFIVVYGLYARHGRAYPPYDPIPDVNYAELLRNFF